MENYNHIDGSEVDPSYWIRFGPDVVPMPKLSAQQTQTVFNQQLNPTMYMTVDSQGITDALLLMRNPVGCEVPTGTNFAIAIPALTSVMRDIYGQPIPGAPQSGSQFVVNYTSDGNPVGQYALSSSPGTSKKLPFVTDFYVGEALGRKEYGTYDWTDGGGVLHKAKGITDPTVTKPEINVLYNPNQFYVDETTNELNISLDGASGVLAGLNITVTPGVGPLVAPTITMASSGVLTDGPYRWAYSWRVKQPDGTYTSTALSPTSFGKAGGGYNSATVEGPANTRVDVDGIYVWRNLNSDAASFYLVTTITSGVNSPWSYDDNTSDGSLLSNTLFTASEPTISTTTTMLLTGDPANADGTPMGTATLGVWGARIPVSGYSYAAGVDSANSGAHLFFALDENHKEDLIFAGARYSDGTTFTYPWNVYADWSITDASGNKPVVSEIMFGSFQADGGVKGLVVSGHDPVDADVIGVANGEDGVFAVRQNANEKSAWYWANGEVNRLANLTKFAGVDASGESINHGIGDLGVGTDGSLWLCTAYGTPGTWVEIPHIVLDSPLPTLDEGVFGYDTTEKALYVGNVSGGNTRIGPSVSGDGALVTYGGASLQTIHYTPVALIWDTAEYDDDSFFSGGSPTRLTAPATGRYRAECSVAIQGGWGTSISTTGALLYLYVNGSAHAYNSVTFDKSDSGSLTATVAVDRPLQLTAADYVEAFLIMNVDSAYDVNLNDSGSWFSLTRIA